MNHFRRILSGLCILLVSQFSFAQLIPSSEYSLTELTASWVWGDTDFNAHCSGSGLIDNVADLAAVDDMLSNGYVDMPANCGGPFNGIYPWPDPDDFHTIEFAMDGGTNVIINQLSFISSRSYSDATDITVDYAIDGGPWITAIATTSGAMGITTGAANTYTLDLGNVDADRFRITTAGDQVAFHEVMIDGDSAGSGPTVPIPTLSGWALILLSLLFIGVAWSRTSGRRIQ